MSVNWNLNGVGGNVELGKGGPRVKDNSGVLEARNNADDALAIVRGATPTASTDFTTKAYADGLITDRLQVRSISFGFETTTPFNIGGVLTSNDRVVRAHVFVSTAFDGTTPTLQIGTSGDTDAVMTTALNDLGTVGVYEAATSFKATGSDQIIGTLTLSGATAGAGDIVLFVSSF